jgi:hypothetical protein
MKAIVKLLFVLALTFCAFTYLPQADGLTAIAGVLLYVMLLTNLVVPVRFLHTGQLNVVTEMKVWNKYIIEKLRRVNDWITKSADESRFVLGGATVYIPQAGNDPTIEVNTSVYPGVAVQRTDSDVNYNLDRYRTVPSHVAWEELQAISYDKIDSVIGMHGNALAEAVGDVILTKWAPTVVGGVVTTTGADVDAVGNQTGTRKGFSHKDLITAMIRMNAQNVPKNNRVAVIDDNMFGYLYDELTASQMNAFQQFANNQTGMLGRLHGFDIYTRSAVLNYATGTYTPNAYAATQLATDNLASLCFQGDLVCRAVGETKLFTDRDNPLYYGDLFSAILRMGGRKRRSDAVGCLAIVQG